MKKPRQFRIDKELLERFDRVNNKLAVNGSEVVRRMIEEYVNEKEKEQIAGSPSRQDKKNEEELGK